VKERNHRGKKNRNPCRHERGCSGTECSADVVSGKYRGEKKVFVRATHTREKPVAIGRSWKEQWEWTDFRR